jgi:hypothetical protein
MTFSVSSACTIIPAIPRYALNFQGFPEIAFRVTLEFQPLAQGYLFLNDLMQFWHVVSHLPLSQSNNSALAWQTGKYIPAFTASLISLM